MPAKPEQPTPTAKPNALERMREHLRKAPVMQDTAGANSTPPEEAARLLRQEWERRCPVDYRKLTESLLPCNRKMLAKVKAHRILEESALLYGPPQKGKTRLAWWLLHGQHFAGVKVLGLDAVDFASQATRAYRNGAEIEWFKVMIRPAILLIDDLGTPKATPRSLESIYAVIERRKAQGKTTIATINGMLEDMESRWGQNPDIDPELPRKIVARLEAWPRYLIVA